MRRANRVSCRVAHAQGRVVSFDGPVPQNRRRSRVSSPRDHLQVERVDISHLRDLQEVLRREKYKRQGIITRVSGELPCVT